MRYCSKYFFHHIDISRIYPKLIKNFFNYTSVYPTTRCMIKAGTVTILVVYKKACAGYNSHRTKNLLSPAVLCAFIEFFADPNHVSFGHG